MKKTEFHSWCGGELAKGCQLCVQGRKLVLFITGLCGRQCFFCPVSEQKYGKDVVFANEWKVFNPDDPKELIEEAKLTEAKGAGITGGDPLVKLDRCIQYITLLKKEFGKDFHIHLYTPLRLVTKETMQRLYNAGLDEIRFHPKLDNKEFWNRLNIATEFDWDVGIEIPAIPGYEVQTKKLIDFVADKVSFINLNELELSDTAASHYKMDQFKPRDDKSYGVKGSREMALDVAEYAEKKGLNVHVCSAKLKDSVQMANRLKLRAKHAALPFDKQTEDGLLCRGCIYLEELTPGLKYRERLSKANPEKIIPLLQDAKKEVENLGLQVVIDRVKLRLLVPVDRIEDFAEKVKELGYVPAIVEEYPTADALEMDVAFL